MAISYKTSNILKDSKQFHSYEEFKIYFRWNGAFVDLTGLPITWEFRVGSQDGVSVKKLTIGDGLSIVTEVVNWEGTNYNVTKLAVDTFSIPVPGDIYYDIRIHFAVSDKIKYWIGGIVKITPVVTKQDG